MAQMEETVLTFKIPDAAGEVYIDIAQCMSMVNRKLYRQQGLWQVRGASLYADVIDTATGDRVGLPYTVSMSGAPRTWVTRNALVKGFSAWRDQQNLAIKAAGSQSIRPRWQDFKVWLNDNHRTSLTITPVSGHMFGGDDPFMLGQWNHSRIVWEDVTGAGLVEQHEPELTILGDDNMPQSVALIKQFALSRAFPQAQDPLTPGSLESNIYTQSAEALSEQVEEITENMQVDGTAAPYSTEFYPGATSNGNEPLLFGYVANTTGATKGRKTTMNGFAAPNGLIEVQYLLDAQEGQTEGSQELWIQLVVGKRIDY